MILWLDDERTPSAGLGVNLVWAKTYDQAVLALSAHEFATAYLDHDLALDDLTGLDVVEWMVRNDKVPRQVIIHSHNVLGAEQMEQALRSWAARVGRHVTIRVHPHGQDAWPDAVELSS